MKRFFSMIIILILFTLPGCSLSFSTAVSSSNNAPGLEKSNAALQSTLNLTTATVIRHVDGDTVYVRFQDGSEYKLRLIGIDTPETVHPEKAVEYFGQEASDFTKDSLLGMTVYLEKDVSETDRYGRLLRYVWLEPPIELSPSEINSKLFNAILVASGYAQVSTYPPDVKYQDHLLTLQREARENCRGLWRQP